MKQAAIVIDSGSGMTKAGFSEEEAPKSIFPTIFGTPLYDNIHGNENKDFYIGVEAKFNYGALDIREPITEGIINDWEIMQKIWSFIYYSELKSQPSELGSFLAISPKTSKKDKEKMINYFFEMLNVPAFYAYSQSALGLYGSGNTTGLIIDFGYGKIDVVPIYEGVSINHAIEKSLLASKSINNKLNDLTNKNLKRFDLDYIKENYCYVSCNFDIDADANERDEFVTLPDDTQIKLYKERFVCTEPIFQGDGDIKGLNSIIFDSISKCETELKKYMYENIVLCGGGSLLRGFSERINKEMHAVAPSSITINIVAGNERKYSTWIGGSILSGLSSFQSSWISQYEYEENGVNIIHRKCL